MMKHYKKAYYAVAVIISFVLTVTLSSKFVEAFQIGNNTEPSQDQVNTSKHSNFVTWDQALSMNKPIAIEFYTQWCGYCKKFAPILESLSSEYSSKYSFVKIDAESPENKDLVQSFGISSYPSFFLVDPKSKKYIFIEQSIYTNPKLVKKEMDNFYNSLGLPH